MSNIDYEPFDLRFRDNPEPLYARLREEAPIYKSPQGYWVVTRYDDVQAIYQDPINYSSSIVGKEAMTQGDPNAVMPDLGEMKVNLIDLMATPSIVASDPPKHTDLRRIVNRAFMPKRLVEWDDLIAQSLDEYMGSVIDGEAWDVVSQLAMPLPVAVICRILAVEPERRADIKRWSDVIITTGQGENRGTPEAQMQMLQMLKEFSDYFIPLIEDRRTNSSNDMISDIVRAEAEETLSNLDTLIFIMSLMVAGNETTTNLIGNTIVNLLENPNQLAKLQADPSLVKNTIEESLRFRSPIQFSIRTPVQDMTIGNQTMKKDDAIVIVSGSANRDPSKFENPEQFDITRRFKSAHFAFGSGIHFCIGFHLAKREATAAIAAILPRLHQWKLDDSNPLKRLDSNLVYGFQKIPLIPK